MATAHLISQSHNLRTGVITITLETKNRSSIITSASKLFNNKSLMKKLAVKDRVLIAYWAGIEEVKTKDSHLKLLKELLSQPT